MSVNCDLFTLSSARVK